MADKTEKTATTATTNFVDGAKNAAEAVKNAVTTQTDKIDTAAMSKSVGDMAENTKNCVGDAFKKAGDFVKPAPPPPEETVVEKAKGFFK
ncbi:hypothetical protein SOVF_035190 [Spinacia oleracea]|nr:hypothetical protein SOVF_035190 [Spinacia oleracea]